MALIRNYDPYGGCFSSIIVLGGGIIFEFLIIIGAVIGRDDFLGGGLSFKELIGLKSIEWSVSAIH